MTQPSTVSSKSLPLIDFHQPLLPQIRRLNRTEYYQVINDYHLTPKDVIHRHLPTSLPLFRNRYMEYLSRTPWYMVPLFWLPIIAIAIYYAYYLTYTEFIGPYPLPGGDSTSSPSPFVLLWSHNLLLSFFGWLSSFTVVPSPSPSYFMLTSLDQFFSVYTLSFFVMGIYIWTFLEYVLHRFMFHSESWIPTRYLYLSFLFHGIHHIHPLDAYRLVMPPSVSVPLVLIFSYGFRYTIFSSSVLSLPLYIIAFTGGIYGYVIYDMIHYSTHHISIRNAKFVPYFSFLQLRHMKHHIDSTHTFSVSNSFWDHVFGTTTTATTNTLPKMMRMNDKQHRKDCTAKDDGLDNTIIASLVVPNLVSPQPIDDRNEGKRKNGGWSDGDGDGDGTKGEGVSSPILNATEDNNTTSTMVHRVRQRHD